MVILQTLATSSSISEGLSETEVGQYTFLYFIYHKAIIIQNVVTYCWPIRLCMSQFYEITDQYLIHNITGRRRAGFPG